MLPNFSYPNQWNTKYLNKELTILITKTGKVSKEETMK